jgi:hypothetical protein
MIVRIPFTGFLPGPAVELRLVSRQVH